MRHRSARMTLQWIKGHDRIQGNEESDTLAKQGMNKWNPDLLNLEIPKEFNIQGAKLSALMQATAYRGILERKHPDIRNTSEENL